MTKLNDDDQLVSGVVEFCNELFPDLTTQLDSRQLMGIVYLLTGNPGKAVIQFNEVLKHLPEHTKIYFLRSKAHLDLGEQDAAYQDYIRGLKNDLPKDYEFIERNPESKISKLKFQDTEAITMDELTKREVLDTLLAYKEKYADPRLRAFVNDQVKQS